MFKILKQKVQDNFNRMSNNHDLFVVDLEKNELFDAYLSAFSDEERQSFNCNCCKSFLNHYGKIVAIIDGKLTTIWDFEMDAPYDKIPKLLRELVISKPIDGPFLSTFDKLGTDFNHQRLESGEVIKWEHFFVQLPKAKVLRSNKSLDSVNGDMQSTKQVFERSLNTITVDALETVLGLIEQNTLYRGKEFEKQISNFLKYKKKYDQLSEVEKTYFIWLNYKDGGRIRNTVIGALLVDLSEGRELEEAVKSFEKMVAPANYKRPTALITNKMIEQAQEKIAELGIEKSLKRRHATKDDIPVTNVLYVNRDKEQLSVFDEMKKETAVNPKLVKVSKEVSLDEFVSNVLPEASKVEFLLENNSNFVSLIAPEDSDSPNIFNWDNKISWTYQNNLTDTIKEKVKQAGGSVEGELRISLEWFNYDDLDLHVVEPDGNKIYFSKKVSPTSTGFLDVDMNAGSGASREAVENVIFKNSDLMLEGQYKVLVNNYRKRENKDFGFNIEVECKGNIYDLGYSQAVHDNETVTACTFKYSRTEGITDFKTTLKQEVKQKQVNNVNTNSFHPVSMVMYSPNHWTNDIGNKHLFLMIDNAKIDTPLRPFFNEFLSSKLQEHRKVFEVVGNKLMVQPADTQLTGVGYSLTQQQSFVTRVNNKLIKVNI